MRFLFGSIGAFILGSFAWWLGGLWNLGAAVILGAIGSGAGLYYGRKLFEEWLGD